MTGGNALAGTVIGLLAGVGVPSSAPVPFSALNPGTWEITHWIALGSFAVAAFSTFQVFRKDKKAEKLGVSDAKMRLDEMIDKRMQTNLESAWKEIDVLKGQRTADRAEIASLKGQVETLQGVEQENQEKTAVIEQVFTRQVEWNLNGRPGDLPLPNRTEVMALGLVHPIVDTLTRKQVNDVAHDGEEVY